MNRNRWVARVGVRWLLSLAVVWCAAPMAWAAGPFEKAIPEDCVAFVNFKNFQELKTKAGETRGAKLWQDPSMQPFVSGVMAEVTKLFSLAEQKSGVNLSELWNAPTGQFTLALRLASNPKEPPYVYLLADVSGKEESVNRLLNRLAQQMEKDNMTKRSVGDFTVFSPQNNQKPRSDACYTVKNGILAFGNDPEALGAALKGIEGGVSNSLAENARFKSFREAAGVAGDVELFVDLNKIISVVSETTPPFAAGAAALGLNAFQSAGLSFAVNQGDFETQTQAIILMRGSSPLLNLFNMPAKSLAPEAWVPENVSSYFTFNWDLDLFYTTLTGIINATAPGQMERVNQMLAGPDPDNPLFNIKKDLIDPLGNRLTVVSDTVEGKKLPTQRTLIAWQLDSNERLNALIDRLMAMAGGALPLQKNSVKGNTVYSFPLGDMLAAQMPNQEMPLPIGVVGFTVAKTHLFLTTHIELLNKVLNNEGGAGLAENANYRRIAAKYPSQTSLISYTNADAQLQSLWQVLKSGQLDTMLRQAMATHGDDEGAQVVKGLVESLDGKKLPEFEKVQKYLAPSGGYGVMNENGVRFMSFTLKQ